ncbi:MAG: 50S ribosomal protein L24 [Candidatus Marinimicrobia bacterium]|jgi:large subunit ribosomal protein L24|nr:50S ribosomal protein L24 [Candidatus Neomarinimicrobiota bacterium]MDP6456050.1 50S ribosomal protein L24 [Candidatus Neomarinimicrobiota bacterium]MDP6592649.1 50S ribosomal protein L24 [Candidatus Neomarinimicrobiota bacterium]MDP6836495.1 50S ribosomal protein L24 [Candidatus Neomarinimicrobiota bacterium]|tara:strand:- start:11793 stop:12101 length:309 start_codon:yes stop_codon:yes gene_type:complete
MNIRKGDTVEVISGDDRGKKGKVLQSYPTTDKIVVEGINFIKRHTRPSQNNPQGGIVEREAPIHVSNVMLVAGGQRTRVGLRFLETGRKVRYSLKTGDDIDS